VSTRCTGRGKIWRGRAPSRRRGRPRVASAHALLQQDRATLEGARAWQSQAEEKANEADGLRTTLANKAVALAAVEEQLRQEGTARQQEETQL
jgi:hypothetical protein